MRQFYFLLFITMPLFTLGQTTLSGRILDTQDQPVGFAGILLKGATTGVVSEADGYFRINVPSGSDATLVVSAIGFAELERTFDLTAGKTQGLELRLTATATELQAVEITGRRETGYRNRTSFSGTKSATALKDVPQSIGYVTKELALDQAAFRVNDVVKNISGVNQFSFYNDITIRGFRVAGQRTSGNLVNGMRSFTSFWKQQLIPHLERVEVIKGPASALFGNASPGGTINRVTKKPLAETRRSISTTVGSFNTLRTLADFTGKASNDGTLLYRLNLGYENSGSFRDLQFDKNLVVAPSFSFLPNDRTRLNVDLVYQGSEGRLDRGQAVFGDGDLFSVPITKALNANNDYLREESVNTTISLTHK
ncbi:MAG: TonB-dependent receptor, partial [Bacteroidota bacterium]